MKTKTKTTTKTKKDKPNRLEKLVLNITNPIKMDQELTFEQICILVGANNSGKTFMLKLAFALGAIGIMRVAPPGPTSSAQFVFDNTFVDQKFDGLFKAVYTKGSVAVELKEGKVTSLETQGETVPVKFMSTDMRTFDQMAMYLRIRKDAPDNDPLAFTMKMLQAYRLYDLTYMEALLVRLPLVLPDSLRKAFGSFDIKESIASIEADLDKCEFHAVMDDGSKRNISTYGKGHQAILNMFIGAQS